MHEQDNEKRLEQIDMARGIAILAVVWVHINALMNPEFLSSFVNYFFHKLLSSFQMPILFMISAALMYKALDGQKLEHTMPYVRKIASKVLWPFYSLGFCFFVFIIAVPKSIYSGPSAKEMMSALLFMQSDLNKLPSSPLWFLFSLFTFIIFTYFTIRKLHINEYLLLSAAILLKIIPSLTFKMYILGLDKFTANLIYFLLGYLLSKEILKKKINPYFTISWIAFWIFGLLYPYMKVGILNFSSLLVGCTGSFAVLGLCKMAQSSFENRFQKIISLFGVNSLLIFVFHAPVLVIAKKIVYRYNLDYSYIGFIIMLFCGIAIPLLIGKILSFNERVSRVLLGRVPLSNGI